MAPFVLAPDKLKGTLSAARAALALARGIARPDTVLVPLADGGDGTLDVLERAAREAGRRAERRTARASGPLGEPRDVEWLLVDTTAIVELARASGLAGATRRDPLRASTRGTGEVARAALEAGAREVVIALGGSATTDGGSGIARALGVRLLDARGIELEEGGGALERLARIDAASLDPRARAARWVALADVRAPLLGPRGSAAVYAPQKGATPEQVAALERGLATLARRVREDLGRDVAALEGAGAAGGAGAGLAGFLGGAIEPGAIQIAREVGLDAKLAGASLAVAAEGRLDATSFDGKVVGEVAARAAHARVPWAVVAGSLGPGWEEAQRRGAREVIVLADLVGLDSALRDPERALELAGVRLAHLGK
jgi:glycerate kinase